MTVEPIRLKSKIEKFTVGGRIKEAFITRREGFVVGGLAEI